MRIQKRKRMLISLIVSIIVYVLINITQIRFETLPPIVMPNGAVMPMTSFNGIFSAIMELICIIMVCTNYKRGLVSSYALMTVSLLMMVRTIIFGRTLQPIPGIAYMVIMIVAISIMYKQFAARQKDSVTDFLTGLSNRRGLIEVLEDKTTVKTPFYLCYVDLDDFKFVNDNLGHKCGDQVLKLIAYRMREVVSKDTVVARLGGDEFVLVFPEKTEIDKVTKKLVERIGEKVVVENSGRYIDCYVTASIGLVKYPVDSKSADTLLKLADIAMYHAKKSGKNKISWFDQTMEREVIRQAELENIIKESLDKDYFYLVYQPQFELYEKKLRGFETLLRLKMPDGSFVSPGEFIPAAEKTDLILKVDDYVITRAMREFSEFMRQHDCALTLAINVSAKNIGRNGFADMVMQVIEETQFPPKCLEIEITEYCLAQSLDTAMENIMKLKEIGVQVALDDFGTGYASLSYLSKLSVDLVKIDKSFIDDIAVDKKSAEFVSAVISIGHLNGSKVISEGVETENQLALLRERECDYVQGYVWGKPMQYEDALLIAEEMLK